MGKATRTLQREVAGGDRLRKHFDDTAAQNGLSC
jgi:hypothetical protein